MSKHWDWKAFLAQWSKDILSSEYVEDLPDEIIASGWLGYPGASETQIARLESRLKAKLPLSYRAFLGVSNGFLTPGSLTPRLLPVEEIDWFRQKNPETIRIYIQAATQQGLTGHVPDEEYFVYGQEQASTSLRPEYLETALQISERELAGTAVMLLNPQIVGTDGEWEAWYFAHWLPGAVRYRSFWELMQAEHQALLSAIAQESKRFRPAEGSQVLAAKLPGLIDEFESKIQEWIGVREHQKANRFPIDWLYTQGIIDGLRFGEDRLQAIQAQAQTPGELHQQLVALRDELERKWKEASQVYGNTASTLGLILSGNLEMMHEQVQASATSEGYREAAGILRWFLNQK